MRVYTSTGEQPKPTEAMFFIQGPQDESQIPKPVLELLTMKGITQVDVRFNHGQGDRIEVFRLIKEKDE